MNFPPNGRPWTVEYVDDHWAWLMEDKGNKADTTLLLVGEPFLSTPKKGCKRQTSTITGAPSNDLESLEQRKKPKTVELTLERCITMSANNIQRLTQDQMAEMKASYERMFN